MSWFRKEWTPEEANEWTGEDFCAMVFSSLCYVLITIGVGLSLLVPVWGLLCLAGAALCGWIMFKSIDPKLRTLSDDYELKQKEYLEELDRIMKWEKD